MFLLTEILYIVLYAFDQTAGVLCTFISDVLTMIFLGPFNDWPAPFLLIAAILGIASLGVFIYPCITNCRSWSTFSQRYTDYGSLLNSASCGSGIPGSACFACTRSRSSARP